MESMDGCVFCEISAGKSPASVILRNERCTAFMDVQPVSADHVLVIPNDHALSLVALPENDGSALFETARDIVAALYRSTLRCDGVNLRLADDEVAGQEIPHVHLHVIPRFEGDGVDLVFGQHLEEKPGWKNLNSTAEAIRNAL
ncbi:MAG: HIT family protein [Rubrobacter sp.]